jgi:hypothetical protein
MPHAQKPDFVFRRNRRFRLNRRGRQFSRLLAAEVCASVVVMLDTPCSVIVWRVLATHSIRQFLLHFPSRASPCAITFQLDCTTYVHRPPDTCQDEESTILWNVRNRLASYTSSHPRRTYSSTLQNCAVCPHSTFTCFVRLKKTAIVTLRNDKRLVFCDWKGVLSEKYGWLFKYYMDECQDSKVPQLSNEVSRHETSQTNTNMAAMQAPKWKHHSNLKMRMNSLKHLAFVKPTSLCKAK